MFPSFVSFSPRCLGGKEETLIAAFLFMGWREEGGKGGDVGKRERRGQERRVKRWK